MKDLLNRCEASGLISPRNADGRVTCPICRLSFSVTARGRLRAHLRRRHDADPATIDAVLGTKRSQQRCQP